MTDSNFDVIIVGAGPAGLSAALILGRCRRRVLVLDSGKPRNAASRGLHGLLTRDGIEPSEFLRIAREQLGAYETVELKIAEVTSATCVPRSFELRLANGERFSCRKLLLATGVVDELPEISGLKELYGRSVFHCPYCDGWEIRDQPLAVYGRGENGAGLALELTLWSRDIVLCTDGASKLTEGELARLARRNIEVREDKIERLDGMMVSWIRSSSRTAKPLRGAACFSAPANINILSLPSNLDVRLQTRAPSTLVNTRPRTLKGCTSLAMLHAWSSL